MSNIKCSNCGGSGKHIGMLGINPNNWPVCTSCNGTGVIEDTKEPITPTLHPPYKAVMCQKCGKYPERAVHNCIKVSSRSTYLEAILSPQIMNEDTCPECRVNFTEAIKAIENLILLREQEAYKKGFVDGQLILINKNELNQ